MNKKEYLDLLSKELGALPYNDVKEITDEIDAHFEMAKQEGKSEEQISDDLGDVHELAKSYINCTPYKLPQVLKDKEPKKKSSTWAKIFSIAICCVAVPITCLWVWFDVGLATKIIASSSVFVLRLTNFGNYGAYKFAVIMNQIGSIFYVIFLGCLLYFGVRLLIAAGKKFIRFNRKLWTRGF